MDENCEPYQDCPPEQPRNGDRVIDADGVLWTYVDYHWVSESGEDYRYTVNEFEGCNPCPPLYLRIPSVMTIGVLSFGSTPLQGTFLEGEAPAVSYIDSYGVRWDYQGGEWVPSDPDQEPTMNIWDIPGMSQDCPIPDCPPNGDVFLGTAFIAPSGEVWTLYDDGWYSSSGLFAPTFGDIAECATPGEINVKIYVDCGPADGPGIIVRVNVSGDADAIVSVTDSVDPSREYSEGPDYWFATWETGADRPVVFTATLTDGSEVTTTETITAEDCGIDETPGVFYFLVDCAPNPNGGYIVTVSPGGDGSGPAIVEVSDSLDPSRVYTESGGEWSSIWPTGSNMLVTFTATGDNGQEEVYRTIINDESCGVPTDDTPPEEDTPKYVVEIKSVTCSYDPKNDQVVLLVSLTGDFEEVSGVTDNDTPPNTYNQSATRTNEWRTAIAADNATGTITITVTYTGGSDTYDVTLSDTFCGVPADTPTYNVEVDPACEYDIEMREYTLTALISGDLDGVERVYDSLDPGVDYAGPDANDTYSRVIDALETTLPVGDITVTAVMDNGETFSSSYSAGPSGCGRGDVFVDIWGVECSYNPNTGFADLDVFISGDIDALASISDSVGEGTYVKSATTPFTWETSGWLLDPEPSMITFDGELKPGFTGTVDPLEGSLSELQLFRNDCGYEDPRFNFKSLTCLNQNPTFLISIEITGQEGTTVQLTDRDLAVGDPGHAQFTTWEAKPTAGEPGRWATEVTFQQMGSTASNATTVLVVTDGRGFTDTYGVDFQDICNW